MVHSFDIISKVRRTIVAYQMFDPGDKVIVAVSGGADSVCLLDILGQLAPEFRLQLVVAHLDHGLRPREDEAETRFVHDLAARKGLAFETAKALLLEKQEPNSLEEKARAARYAFLEEVQQKHKAQKIALGHTLNDQAETVLMRLLRGSGAKGLSGIPPRRGAIVRPLIELEEPEIRAYLEQEGQDFMTDSSNLETLYLRNKIRLNLLPQLLEYQPRLIRRLGHLAELLREENDYLEQQATQWLKDSLPTFAVDPVTLPLRPFLAAPAILQKYIIRLLIQRVKKDLRRVHLGHVQAILKLAQADARGNSLHLPNGLLIRKRQGRLFFLNTPEPGPAPFSFLIPGPGRFEFEAIRRVFVLTEKDMAHDKPDDSPWVAFLDAAKITYPLRVRNFLPGDRFMPLGMQGHKKLKNFFIDLKIPRELRPGIPILLSNESIVWICGYRPDERFKVTPQTKRVLEIKISEI